ncbi:MAG: tyrosine-protein phosphatase [Dysgonamonadaceae bacterium]|jgi:protein-tyrosine phosphatase|nr:tyrosine-protein phosphatase [Dysgonamonadaceae bacterium]
MIKKAFFLFLHLAVFSSCTKEKPDIHAVCELTPSGIYLIKWEIYPPLEGSVKIYESSRPDSFDLNSPVAEQNISVGYKNVLSMPSIARTYFNLVFNKEYSVITTSRSVPMQKILNFRDIGGYFNKTKKQIRWGKLYRSGSLAPANRYDIYVLNSLGIETIIDLRTENDNYFHPIKYQPERIFNLPLRGNNHSVFYDKILAGEMKKRDAFIHSQDFFSFLLENNTDYFIKMFDILSDEKNYPLVFFCSLGRDRSAIATALILSALDIDRETILNDFMLSNDLLVDFYSLMENADLFSSQEVQETLTALFNSNREYLTYALERIEKEYGSIQNYLEKELKLTHKKREKLKEILLSE